MQFFLGDRISPHMARLKDGALLCQSVPLCRTGQQLYRATELATDGGVLPEGMNVSDMVSVFRPASEVLSTRTMASLESVPICDDHPPQFVNTMNYAVYQKGHVQNIRQGPQTPEGEYTIVGDLIIRDAALSDKIERNLKREISIGYTCSYTWDGRQFVQRDIVANHCAVVKLARGGQSLAVMDAMPGPDWEHIGQTLGRLMDYPEAWSTVADVLELIEGIK